MTSHNILPKHPSQDIIKLSQLASEWTDEELSLLLEALKRDRSLTPTELAEYLNSKTKTQIRELFRCLLNVEEFELCGKTSSKHEVKPEGSLDILLQTTRHCTTEDYNYSLSLSESFKQLAVMEEEKYRIYGKKDSNPLNISMSQLYYFMSALVTTQSLPSVSNIVSGAILDLLTCLVRLLNIINPKTSENNLSKEFEQLDCKLSEELRPVTDMIKDQVGIFLAAAAGVNLLARLYSRRTPMAFDLPTNHPVAPLFFLSSVSHPKTLKQARFIVRHLLKQFSEVWSLPKLTKQQLSIDFSKYEPNSHKIGNIFVPNTLFKRLTMFTLNPFSCPFNVMAPLQSLLDQFNKLCYSRFPLLNQFKSIVYESVPPVRASTPNSATKRSRTSKAQSAQFKKPRLTETDNNKQLHNNTKAWESTMGEINSTDLDKMSSTETTTNQEKISVSKLNPSISSFVRVTNPEEDEFVRRIINRCIKIRKEETVPTAKQFKSRNRKM